VVPSAPRKARGATFMPVQGASEEIGAPPAAQVATDAYVADLR
jgi:hypothetical protein